MKLEGVLFLAGYTSRSKSYAQAMYRDGLIPDHIFLYGVPAAKLVGAGNQNVDITRDDNLFMPNLSVDLADTVNDMGSGITILDECDVNSAELSRKLSETSPELVIYSGYGGQIVPKALCDKYMFLHMHSGLLPQYRGSTTIYYSILLEKGCGVTGILLNEGIDSGEIVSQRCYPLPPKGVDIDFQYDNAIRADLLTKTLAEYCANNSGFAGIKNRVEEGDDYYVIHPVLKNIAIELLKSN
jgi:methionyl-tRNA formyltransferase